MTNQNNASRQVMTAGQILALERRSNMTDDEALRYARAIETAVLSKLRAPVADPLAAFEAWSKNTNQGYDLTRMNSGKLATFESDLTEHAWRGYCHAALASAPVAGEAQKPVGTLLNQHGEILWHRKPDYFPADFYAAPQASEAVRDQDLAPWTDYTGNPIRHGDRIRHPEGLEGVVVRLPGYANAHDAWCVAYQDRTVSRLSLQIGERGQAALSAQPGAQRTGGSDG